MAIRFDVTDISRNKPVITGDGTLLADAKFARDGVLVYTRSDGSTRREFRPPEENQKAVTEFGLLPVTIEHTNGLITEDNADDARKGITLQNVRYEHVTGKGGFVSGQVAVFDSKAKNLLLSGEKCQLSLGYKCRVEESPGYWVNPETGKVEHYDAIQRDIVGNHMALTGAGRAGPDCAVKMDSLDGDEDIAYSVVFDSQASQSTKEQRMATLTIGSASYEAPETLVGVVAPRLERLDALENYVPSLEEQAQEQEQLIARLQVRADSAEFILGNANEILEGLGYVQDSEGFYHLTAEAKADSEKTKCDECAKKEAMDAKGKKMMPPDDDEEDEDPEEEASETPEEEATEMAEEGKNKNSKKGKTKKRGDSEAVRTDSVKDLLIAFKEADSLVPAVEDKSFSALHMDSLETVAGIRRKVVEELSPKLFPNFKLEGKNDSQIEVAYEMIKDAASTQTQKSADRHDSSYSISLTGAIAEARRSSSKTQVSPADEAQAKVSQETQEAWQKPLSLSR